MAELTAAPARRRVGSAVLVLAGASLFGTVGTAQALGPFVPPPQLAAARLVLAGVMLVGIVLLTGHRRGLLAVGRHAPTWWAGIGQACFNVCFLGAMDRAGVAVGTLVAIGATPVITGLAARHVTRRWLVATTVALSGLVMLVGGQAGEGRAVSAPGVLLALAASASYATYILAGDAAARRALPTQPYLAVAFGIAGLLTAPLLLAGDFSAAEAALLAPASVLLVAYLAAVPTVLAYNLFNRGLGGVRPGTAATLGLAEPVVAAALAVVVLQERLGPVAVGGVMLVLAGLLVLVRTGGAEDQREADPHSGMAR